MEGLAKFLDELTAWGEESDGVLGIGLVGTRVHQPAASDNDIDVLLVVEEPDDWIEKVEWIRKFGTVDRREDEGGEEVCSIRVFYEDGREVEFGITDRRWAHEPIDDVTSRVVGEGCRILYDSEQLLQSVVESC